MLVLKKMTEMNAAVIAQELNAAPVVRVQGVLFYAVTYGKPKRREAAARIKFICRLK